MILDGVMTADSHYLWGS